MSRPDSSLRHRVTGRLWHGSYKTASIFPEIKNVELQTDIQRWLESYAIWAKYGEPPEGTLYTFFLKGDKYWDKDLRINRFGSGLIHPWQQVRTVGFDFNPENFSPRYKWQEDGRNRQLGTTWTRCDIWGEINFMEWLDLLRDGVVKNSEGYLADVTIPLREEPFIQNHAEQWKRGFIQRESKWANSLNALIEGPKWGVDYDELFDQRIYVEPSQCVDRYNNICPYHTICWGNNTIESLVDMGKLKPREPNHQTELFKVTTRQTEEVM
jgi:hypothetical protein